MTRAEKAGSVEAAIHTRDGPIVRKDYRNNDRYIFDDEELAKELWDLLKEHDIYEDDNWLPIGLNEKFRLYRYTKGQHFALHKDSQFKRSETEMSFQTILIYLNEGYEGGETDLFGLKTVIPETGKALLFFHHLLHEGLPLISKTKYVLRSDIMYKKK